MLDHHESNLNLLLVLCQGDLTVGSVNIFLYVDVNTLWIIFPLTYSYRVNN